MLIKALTNPIYHYVKGFYHEHKNHTDDCDSILDAYVCTKESDSQISSPDNKPLIFYLRQYENDSETLLNNWNLMHPIL